MQQHSIFEPLSSFQSAAPSIMELMNVMERKAPHEQAFTGPSHSWFTETPPPSTTCIGIRRASCSSLPFSHINHVNAPIAASNFAINTAKLNSSSTLGNEQESPCSNSFPKACDDGSVANKLLSSITKSISSPSLHLACSKEATRETPYQKSLRLKHMKLQHCAEALGMESSDSSSPTAGYDIITQSMQLHEQLDMTENLAICPSSGTVIPFKISNQEYSPLTSVKSAPNLSAPPMMMTCQTSKYMRCASFPPPLSHTLPASPSCDSLSPSLRSYRQDGRLILKEVMVPSKNYFCANRRDGRLTLHILTRDLAEDEEEYSASQYHQQGVISSEPCELEDAIMEKEDMKLKKSMISVLDQPAQIELNLKKLQCSRVVLHSPHRHGSAAARHVKSNIISSVIALTLQTINHFKLTLPKAQSLNCLQSSSSYPLSSGSMNQLSIAIHPPGNSHLLPSSHHDMSTFSESKENFIWESNLLPCIAAVSRPKRNRRGEDASSCVLEELHANSLMKIVTEANNINKLADAWPNELDTSTMIEAYNALRSVIMGGGRSSGQAEYIANRGNRFNGQLGFNHQDEEKVSIGLEPAGKEVSSFSSLYSTLASPPPPPYLQTSDEWLHTLHCKELSDRNQFGICSFIQPHSCYIATRS